ncbi:hypothetical protein AN641_09175 [Candidatus Epulonipiscioides gigas]|nr:hypothetical protein AN641_09175 [Epulopiscium sp. SCG-C07WGA-EpuloA2]
MNNSLDQAINSELIRVSKCILPYLEKDLQKQVAISIKIMELINTIKFYNEEEIFSIPKEGDWQKDLLMEISKNLNPDKAYIIEALLKADELRSLLNTQASTAQYSDEIVSNYYNTYSDKNPQPTYTSYQEPDIQPIYTNYQDSTPQETYNSIPKQNAQTTPSDIIKSLSPLLDEKQQQILSAFTTFLTN